MNTETASATRMGLSRRRYSRRSGFAAVMAMLFLVLGMTMAAGLYSLTRSSTAITGSEQAIASAQAATDSGLQFFKYQLAQAVKTKTSSISVANVDSWVSDLKTQLATAVEGHNGVAANSVGYSSAVTSNGSVTTPPVISVPSISLGSASLSGTITTDASANLILQVTGTSGAVSRAASVTFTVTPGNAGPPVPFALAAKGGIPSADNVNATGTKGLTYTPVSGVPINGGGTATVLPYPGMTVPASMDFPNNDALIQSVAALNLKPITDTSTQTTQTTVTPAVYDKHGNLVTPAGTVTTVVAQNSCRIPRGTNPTLSGTINGIIYIEAGNNVTFGDTMTLNGTLVFQRNTGGYTSTLDLPRGVTCDRNMDDSLTQLQTVPNLASANADQLKWWALIAPDVPLSMHNGTTWGATKAFEGSLHIQSFSRQGGGNQLAFQITKGGMVAEGSISMQSNGAEYLINPDASGEAGGTGTNGKVALTWTSYDEGAN